MKPKEKLLVQQPALSHALPPPSNEAINLAGQMTNLLKRFEGATSDVAEVGKGFRAIENRLRDLREQHDASRKRNLEPANHARNVALIAEVERTLNEAETRLITADATRTMILKELAELRGQLEAAVTSEALPMFEAARHDFLDTVDTLTVSWIKLSAAAEAADLELTFQPSIENPVGHEVFANSKVLGPKIADAVGDDWRSTRGVVKRARRAA
jgi:chromosome segregation ATPase